MRVRPFSYLQQQVVTPSTGLPNINTTGLLTWVDANFPGASPTTQWDDNSGNGNHLTVTSGGTGTNPSLVTTTDEAYYQLTGNYISPGVNGSQDGGGYFTQAGSPFTTTQPDLTLTVWIYPDLDYSQSWTVGRWISAGTGGSPGTRLFYGSGFGSTNFGYATTTYNPSPASNPTQNAWQEYTITYDRLLGTNGVTWYKNGSQYSQTSSGPNLGSLTIGTKPLHIGKQFDNLNEYFSGRIAMVFIYERVLSSTEVLSNYNAVVSRYNY